MVSVDGDPKYWMRVWRCHVFPFRKMLCIVLALGACPHLTLLFSCLINRKVMKKNQKARKKEVLSLLKKQKIRSIEQIDAYKLSVCHPHSAGIDLGCAETVRTTTCG